MSKRSSDECGETMENKRVKLPPLIIPPPPSPPIIPSAPPMSEDEEVEIIEEKPAKFEVVVKSEEVAMKDDSQKKVVWDMPYTLKRDVKLEKEEISKNYNLYNLNIRRATCKFIQVWTSNSNCWAQRYYFGKRRNSFYNLEKR